MCRIRIQLHTFACGYPFFPALFVEDSVLSPLSGFCFLVKDHLTTDMRVCPWLSMLFHWSVCLSLCQHRTALVYSFVIYLDVRKHGSYNFVLWFWLYKFQNKYLQLKFDGKSPFYNHLDRFHSQRKTEHGANTEGIGHLR